SGQVPFWGGGPGTRGAWVAPAPPVRGALTPWPVPRSDWPAATTSVTFVVLDSVTFTFLVFIEGGCDPPACRGRANCAAFTTTSLSFTLWTLPNATPLVRRAGPPLPGQRRLGACAQVA